MMLERLKYLNGAGRLRKPGEDLAHWADRSREENLWVRDIALPVLLELAEAAAAYIEDDGSQTVHLYGELEAALAKLEGGAE